MVRRAVEIPVRGEDVIGAGDSNFPGVVIERRRFHQVGCQDIARNSRGLCGRRGENIVALLLRRESYRRRRRLRPHPVLVFQQLVGPVGKICFSNHHAKLWKGHGN